MEKTEFGIIYKYKWLIVPAIAFIGIILGVLFFDNPFLGYAGSAGCVIASFILAYTAYKMPKKDLLSLLTPVYAILIFNPFSEFSSGLIMQFLYAVTLLAIAYRLEKRFNTQ